ncbi:hypothetical protein SAMN02990966_00276 [Rhodospirillales bacterium URHD0017]|nr:hypothetical protein SAMN02990966_00276 [Rhodospirillales bacterium URHD0017]
MLAGVVAAAVRSLGLGKKTLVFKFQHVHEMLAKDGQFTTNTGN